MLPFAIALHLMASAVWVGGMFFAVLALRPALAETPAHERLNIWRGVFARFFVWVWVAVASLWGSGLWIVYSVYGGFGVVAPHVHLMTLGAAGMTVLFAYLFFGPYRTLKDAQDGTAALALASMRRIITVNLFIGLTTLAVGAIGEYLG